MGGALVLYTLMNKNTPVLEFSYDRVSGAVVSVGEVLNLDAAPLSIWNERLAQIRDLNLASVVNRFWAQRGIPSSRINLKEAQRLLEFDSPKELLEQARALSLSDPYWIRPAESSLTWEECNYFTNDFDSTIGKILANVRVQADSFSALNPSSAVGGNLPKMWVCGEDDARYLLKAGSGVLKQEPFNEVVACLLYGRLFDDGYYVPYSLDTYGAESYSKCPCMVDECHELVSAEDVLRADPANYASFECADMESAARRLGIEGMSEHLDRLMVCDYILGNIDRHGHNFGVIRNTETRTFEGVAPIYDSGLSLLSFQGEHDQDTREILANPFFPRQQLQLALVKDFSWIDFDSLGGVADEAVAVLESCPSRYMDAERLAYLHAFVESGIETVEVTANSPRFHKAQGIQAKAELIAETKVEALSKRGCPPVFVVR